MATSVQQNGANFSNFLKIVIINNTVEGLLFLNYTLKVSSTH